MIQFPLVSILTYKSFEFKLACSACSSILDSYENVLIKPMGKSILHTRKNTSSTKTQAGERQPKAHPEEKKKLFDASRTHLIDNGAACFFLSRTVPGVG